MLTLWPLLLPVAAASGWWLAKNKGSDDNKESASSLSRQYFVGLNYLLNEQQDKAVDVFIKLLEVDSDTVETHLALGSLFRRRGEVDRAIRIHQNLIARPQLSHYQKIEALIALGHDYMSAGVLDRAERIFLEVETINVEQKTESLQSLLMIYQQEKAWEKAISCAQQIQLVTSISMRKVIAHHHCELVETYTKNRYFEKAQEHLKQALLIDKNSVRASILQGELEFSKKNYKAAIKAYKRVPNQDPDFISEIVSPLVECYQQLYAIEECYHYLNELLRQYPRVSIIYVLAQYLKNKYDVEQASDFMADQLSHYPSLRGLNCLIQWHIDSTYGKVRDKLEMLYQITSNLIDNKPIYRCGKCGFSGKHLHWQCPSCKEWSAIKPIHGLEGD